MKYADCPTVEVSATIKASAADVWALVSDISLPVRFSAELQAATWLDGATGPSVGATFAGQSRHDAIGQWETVCVVTACDPDRCFEWAVGDAEHPSSRWRFTIVPEGDGDGDGVRLEQWFQMGPARSGLSFAIDAMPDKEERIVAKRLEEHRINMQATVDGVKAAAEATRS